MAVQFGYAMIIEVWKELLLILMFYELDIFYIFLSVTAGIKHYPCFKQISGKAYLRDLTMM